MTYIAPDWATPPGLSMTAGDHTWTDWSITAIRETSPEVATLIPPQRSDPTLYYSLYHLARCTRGAKRVIEVGPGVGYFAQAYMQLYPECEYTVIDLPWRVEELAEVLPTARVLDVSKTLPTLSCDLFVSTFGLDESTRDFVDYVVDTHFFMATNILLGFRATIRPGVLPDILWLYHRLLALGYEMEVCPYDDDSRYVIT